MTTDPTPTELDHDVREEWAARLQCADVGVDFPWLTEDGCDAWREQPVAAQEHYREMLRVALSAGLQIPPTAAVSAAAPNEREVRSALASVLCDAASYPAEVGAHILGSDLSRLVDAATAAVLAARPAPTVNAGPLRVEYGLVWDDLGSADTFPTLEQARAAARGLDEPPQVVRIETWPAADDEGRAEA